MTLPAVVKLRRNGAELAVRAKCLRESFKCWPACLFALLLSAAVAGAHAQTTDGVEPYEEYGKHLRAAQEVSPMKSDAFGDKVSLYNGATEFEALDISIPGNNGLPVELRRRFAVEGQHKQDPGNLRGFADWDLDIPYIAGTFTQANGWALNAPAPYNRCSDNADLPNVTLPIQQPNGDYNGVAYYWDIWDGNHLHMPAHDDQELLVNNEGKLPKVSDGKTYPWITKGFYQITCVAQAQNGLPGEAFVAVSPDGVRYTFDYAVIRSAPILMGASLNPNGNAKTKAPIARQRVYLLLSHVQDRFGNWVNYSYSGDHLTQITASDGRQITLNWSGDTITSVSSAAGTWTYSYANGYLSAVTRPDGSQWRYSIVSGSLTTTKFLEGDDKPPAQHCQIDADPDTGDFIYSVGAPSGATATYHFSYMRHSRNGVPYACNTNTANTNYPPAYDFYDNFALVSKQITGVGLPPLAWSYAYQYPGGAPNGYYIPSQPAQYPLGEDYVPAGPCGCTPWKVLVVTGPTDIVKYTFGIQYAVNEGRLLSTEYDGLDGTPLKTVTQTYLNDGAIGSQAFPDNVGVSQLPIHKNPMVGRLRPVVSTVISQDGVNFSRTHSSFDAFMEPTSITRASSLGFGRTETAQYVHNLGAWVIGQVGQVTNTDTGLVTQQTHYDPATSLPMQTYAFGKLQSTHTYNGDGTLATVADGNGHATTLSNWYRGLPRNVGYADGTGESIAVNDAGWITAYTDENGYTTQYAYDAMGRMSQIIWPGGDPVTWNTSNVSFVQVNGSEYGLDAGHWHETFTLGNYRKDIYYDALWRPVLQSEQDVTNPSATLRFTAKGYDQENREVFAAYPVSSVGAYNGLTQGAHTTYDAIGRVTAVSHDSEFGALTTTTAYLAGFQTRVTNPRGNSTTTSYEVFDTPDTDHPISIQMPEGATTTIVRDVFGKPYSITRSGSYNGNAVAVTRSYVYDAYQQLCKRIEPETGATLMDYDAAGNLAWTAPGTTLTSNLCDRGSVAANQQITRAYDARNRVTAVTYPDGFSSTTYGYTPDGLLASAQMANGGNPVNNSYTYNKRRLLVAETLQQPNWYTWSIGYGYDANAHLVGLSYPDGFSVNYAPNALGQPTQAGPYATNVSYYPNGAIRSFTYGNGAVHTMQQNARQLPTRSTDAVNGAPVLDDSYAYDDNGNVAAISDGTTGNAGNRDMTYDGLDRLTSTLSPMFGGDNKAVYAYDPLDNLRSARVGARQPYTYGYDPNNRLTSLLDPSSNNSLVSLAYDARGNLSRRNGQTYEFDLAHRMKDAVGSEYYRYDASGRRVLSWRPDNTLRLWQYNHAGELLFEGDQTNFMNYRYVYLGASEVARVGHATQPPKTPGAITVPASVTTINVPVTWSGSNGAESYVLQQSADGGTNWTQVYRDAATSTTVAVPDVGSYLFRVSACNDQCSGFVVSQSVAVNVPPQGMATVTVPAISGNGAYTVSWTAVANASRYVLNESVSSGSAVAVYSGNGMSWSTSGKGEGNYGYQVQACNAYGCGAGGSAATVTVMFPPSTAPSVSVGGDCWNDYKVNWGTVSKASSYLLQESFNGGAWSTVYSGSATTWNVSFLGDGTYAFRVQAANAGGAGPMGDASQTTIQVPPARPTPPGGGTRTMISSSGSTKCPMPS
ncbi:RHS repeat domain-containing protein [Burkholderia pseudomallei]|uniref:RHS repeat domain-containing protein n=1 Tax=Burkholderia pseudomallei TaxID=28450 RepID=UPI0009B265EC|nr:RHS repeat protein [Burkholderia pseudomallei]